MTALNTRGWERSAATIRPWLKIRGSILAQLTQPLDAMKALGIDAIKIFMPCAGGMADGLDTIDFYRVDLVAHAHCTN